MSPLLCLFFLFAGVWSQGGPTPPAPVAPVAPTVAAVATPVSPPADASSSGVQASGFERPVSGVNQGLPVYNNYADGSYSSFDDFSGNAYDLGSNDYGGNSRSVAGNYGNNDDNNYNQNDNYGNQRNNVERRLVPSGLVFKTELDELRNRLFQLDRVFSAFTQGQASADNIANFWTRNGRLTVPGVVAGSSSPQTFTGRQAIAQFFDDNKDKFPPEQATLQDVIVFEDLRGAAQIDDRVKSDIRDDLKSDFVIPQAARVRAILVSYSVDNGEVVLIADISDLWVKAQVFVASEKKKDIGPSPLSAPNGAPIVATPPAGPDDLLNKDKDKKQQFAPVRWFLADRSIRCIFLNPNGDHENMCENNYNSGYGGSYYSSGNSGSSSSSGSTSHPYPAPYPSQYYPRAVRGGGGSP